MFKGYPERYRLFRAKLKQARIDAGLTQQQAAKLMGIRQQCISKCETGERRVDFIELIEFSRIYNKPVSYFEP